MLTRGILIDLKQSGHSAITIVEFSAPTSNKPRSLRTVKFSSLARSKLNIGCQSDGKHSHQRRDFYSLSEIYGQLVLLGFVVCYIRRLERCRAGLCYCNSDVCDCCCDRWLYLFCRQMEQSFCVRPRTLAFLTLSGLATSASW